MFGALLRFHAGDEAAGLALAQRAIELRGIYWGTSWEGYAAQFASVAEEVAASSPKRPRSEVLLLLARLRLGAGDREGGVALLRRAAEADPTLVRPPNLLAEIYSGQNRIGDAAEWYARAAALTPDDASLLSSAGAFLTMAGRDQEAALILERAVRLDPGNFKPRINLVLALYSGGESARARRAAEDALKRFPDRKVLLGMVSLYPLLDLSDVAAATRLVEELGDELATVPVGRALKIVALEKAGHGEEARAEMRKLVGADPDVLKDGFLTANWSLRRGILSTFIKVRDSVSR